MMKDCGLVEPERRHAVQIALTNLRLALGVGQGGGLIPPRRDNYQQASVLWKRFAVDLLGDDAPLDYEDKT